VAGLVVWRRRTKLVTPIPVQAGAADALSFGGIDTVASDQAAVDGSGLLGGAVPPGDSGELMAGERVEIPLLVVRVLGRLEVEGATGPIRRRGVERALVALAVNCSRAVASEELRRYLAQDELSEPTAATLRSELSRLRAVLPEGVLPDRAAGSGYCLAGPVEVDWLVFKALAAEARDAEGARRLAVAGRALSLVRGPVLEGGGWHGIDRTVWEIEAAVELLAADTARWAMEAGEAALARLAAAQGLLAVPGSPGLWQLRIRAAQAGSGENVTVVVERARLLTDPT
jgi:hypothetical protein